MAVDSWFDQYRTKPDQNNFDQTTSPQSAGQQSFQNADQTQQQQIPPSQQTPQQIANTPTQTMENQPQEPWWQSMMKQGAGLVTGGIGDIANSVGQFAQGNIGAGAMDVAQGILKPVAGAVETAAAPIAAPIQYGVNLLGQMGQGVGNIAQGGYQAGQGVVEALGALPANVGALAQGKIDRGAYQQTMQGEQDISAGGQKLLGGGIQFEQAPFTSLIQDLPKEAQYPFQWMGQAIDNGSKFITGKLGFKPGTPEYDTFHQALINAVNFIPLMKAGESIKGDMPIEVASQDITSGEPGTPLQAPQTPNILQRGIGLAKGGVQSGVGLIDNLLQSLDDTIVRTKMTNVGPYSGIKNLGTSIAQSPLGGATLGLMNQMGNAVESGGTQTALNMGQSALNFTKQIFNPLAGSRDDAALAALKSLGVENDAPAAMYNTSPALAMVSSMASKGFFGGKLQDGIQAVKDAILKKVEDTKDQLTPLTTNVATGQAMQKSLEVTNQARSDMESNMYDTFKDLVGGVPNATEATTTALSTIVNTLENSNAGNPILPYIKDIQENLQGPQTYQKMWNTAQDLRTKIGNTSDVSVNGNQYHLQNILDAVKQDMNATLTTIDPNLAALVRTINGLHADIKTNVNGFFAKKIFNAEGEAATNTQPEELMKMFMNKDKYSQIPQMFQILGDNTANAIRGQFLSTMVKNASQKTGEFDMQAFAKGLDKYGDEFLSHMFTPEQVNMLNMMRTVGNASKRTAVFEQSPQEISNNQMKAIVEMGGALGSAAVPTVGPALAASAALLLGLREGTAAFLHSSFGKKWLGQGLFPKSLDAVQNGAIESATGQHVDFSNRPDSNVYMGDTTGFSDEGTPQLPAPQQQGPLPTPPPGGTIGEGFTSTPGNAQSQALPPTPENTPLPSTPESAAQELGTQGGFTMDLNQSFKDMPKGTPQYSVSPYPEKSMVISGQADANDIANFIDKNKDLLAKPNHTIGGIYDSATNQTTLEVTTLMDNQEKATAIGKIFGQGSVYDLKNGVEVPTGNAGPSGPQGSILSPEQKQAFIDQYMKVKGKLDLQARADELMRKIVK